nr:chromate resistance protein ChrB domain-containing protein [uncultured Flavobacterium sp.]
MKWITRERPKIDRIACPWLIKNFVDKDAEFIYVPAELVIAKAKELDAIPFDVPDVEHTHIFLESFQNILTICLLANISASCELKKQFNSCSHHNIHFLKSPT